MAGLPLHLPGGLGAPRAEPGPGHPPPTKGHRGSCPIASHSPVERSGLGSRWPVVAGGGPWWPAVARGGQQQVQGASGDPADHSSAGALCKRAGPSPWPRSRLTQQLSAAFRHMRRGWGEPRSSTPPHPLGPHPRPFLRASGAAQLPGWGSCKTRGQGPRCSPARAGAQGSPPAPSPCGGPRSGSAPQGVPSSPERTLSPSPNTLPTALPSGGGTGGTGGWQGPRWCTDGKGPVGSVGAGVGRGPVGAGGPQVSLSPQECRCHPSGAVTPVSWRDGAVGLQALACVGAQPPHPGLPLGPGAGTGGWGTRIQPSMARAGGATPPPRAPSSPPRTILVPPPRPKHPHPSWEQHHPPPRRASQPPRTPLTQPPRSTPAPQNTPVPQSTQPAAG